MVSMLGVLWLALFAARKDLRHQQMFVSLFTAPAALAQVFWFYKDYWRPEYAWTIHIHGVPFGIEEILFSFFVGGIGAVLYEVCFKKKYRRGSVRLVSTSAIALFGILFFMTLYLSGLISIWASACSLIAASLAMIVVDRDLRMDWLMSSVLMFFTVIFIYLIWFAVYPDAVQKLWVPSGLSGTELFGIPIEELVWYTSWAMFSGVAYEFFVNAGPYTKRKAVASRRANI
jgi:hypothetical protein